MLLALTGCGGSAGHPATTALDPITESSTCVEWDQATTAQQDEFAGLVAPRLAVPAKYQEGAATQAYAYGVLAGRCHQAEVIGEASRTTLGKLLNTEPSSSGASSTEATPSDDFLTPLPAVTIGSEQGGRWSIVLDKSILSTQPLSGSAATGPSDRLLELRVTVTYLTPGPPAEVSFAERGFQVEELPSDFGQSHAPSASEDVSEASERCTTGEISSLCEIIGSGGWDLYVDEDGTPGGAILQSALNEVEPNTSEAFWLVGHLSDHVKPSHIVFAVGGQALSAMPQGSR